MIHAAHLKVGKGTHSEMQCTVSLCVENRTKIGPKIGPNLLHIRRDSDALPLTAALLFPGLKADLCVLL